MNSYQSKCREDQLQKLRVPEFSIYDSPVIHNNAELSKKS